MMRHALLCCLLPPLFGAQKPADDPRIVVDPGSHTGAITSFSVDSKQDLLVTGSTDKTVRLWDLHDGELIKTIHLPIAPEPLDPREGGVYAVAISPDDRTIAYGGDTGSAWHQDKDGSFFTYDRQNDLITEHRGFSSGIVSLAFTPDGKYLLYSTRGRTAGIARRDSGYTVEMPLRVSGGVCLDIHGDQVAMLWKQPVAQSSEVFLRMYRFTGRGLEDMRQIPLNTGAVAIAAVHAPVFSVRFTPDGQWLLVSTLTASGNRVIQKVDPKSLGIMASTMAIAGENDGPLELLPPNGKSLRFLTPAVLPVESGVRIWGQFQDDFRSSVVLRWMPTGRGTTMIAFPLPDVAGTDGKRPNSFRILTSSSAGDWTLWDFPSRDLAALVRPKKAAGSHFGRLLEYSGGLGVSADGLSVQFVQNEAQHVFSIARRGVSDGTASPAENVRYHEGTRNLIPVEINFSKLPERPISSEALGGMAFLGSDSGISGYQRGELLWYHRTTTPALQLRATADGKLVLAFLADGSFRWLSADKGELRLSAFLSPDLRRWIAWTPEGYYDAGPESEGLAGWLVNRTTGTPLSADFYSLSRFRDQYYSPEKVRNALRGPAAPVVLSRDVSNRPVVSISEQHDLTITTDAARTRNLPFTVKSADPNFTVDVRVCGRPYTQQARGLTADVVALQLPALDCDVSVSAKNSAGAGEPDVIHVHYRGPKPDAPQRPRLLFLGVGISAYPQDNGRWKLGFARKDAQDLAAEFSRQKGLYYSDVVEKLLLDGDAKRQSIVTELLRLQKNATANDFVVIFLAGHGIAEGSSNYYLPADFAIDPDLGSVAATGLNFSEITEMVGGIRAHTLVLLDACHAGGLNQSKQMAFLDLNRVANGLTDTNSGGAVVLTASTNAQAALESAEFGDHGNGAFTAALKDALRGGAMLDDSQQIKLGYLKTWVKDRVASITCNRQTPDYSGKGEFAIAAADRHVKPAPVSCPAN